MLTDRLVEHLTGVRLHSERERLEHLLTLEAFLRGDLPGSLNPDLPPPPAPGPLDSLTNQTTDDGPRTTGV